LLGEPAFSSDALTFSALTASAFCFSSASRCACNRVVTVASTLASAAWAASFFAFSIATFAWVCALATSRAGDSGLQIGLDLVDARPLLHLDPDRSLTALVHFRRTFRTVLYVIAFVYTKETGVPAGSDPVLPP
jgi:hypothetical protein